MFLSFSLSSVYLRIRQNVTTDREDKRIFMKIFGEKVVRDGIQLGRIYIYIRAYIYSSPSINFVPSQHERPPWYTFPLPHSSPLHNWFNVHFYASPLLLRGNLHQKKRDRQKERERDMYIYNTHVFSKYLFDQIQFKIQDQSDNYVYRRMVNESLYFFCFTIIQNNTCK